MLCLVYRSLALWQRGYPDQALQKNQEALSLARQLSHPLSLAHLLTLSSLLFTRFRREEHLAQDCITETIAVSHEHGFPFFGACGLILQGWTVAELGQVKAGIEQMHQGMEVYQALVTGLCRPYFLSLLAAGYAKNGHSEEGLPLLSEALELVAQSGKAMWEAELYRLRGELTLIKNDERRMMNDERKTKKPKRKTQRSQVEDEAEACFQQALEVARRQEGKSLELRAAVSLGRLWQQQGKSEEARQLLGGAIPRNDAFARREWHHSLT